MKTILVTAIGSFSANESIRRLKDMGFRVACCDIYPAKWLAQASDGDVFRQAPYAVKTEEYMNFLLRYIQEEEIAYILPSTDVEVDLLNEQRDGIEKSGAILCISPEETIRICRDKEKFSQKAGESGFVETIPTWNVTEKEVPHTYPVMVKPVNGRSSQGLKRIENAKDYQTFAGTAPEGYIAQPYLKGSVVTVDVVRSRITGQSAALARRELIRTGNGAGLSVLVYEDRLLTTACCKLAEYLGIEGCVNMEFIEGEDNRYHILECNPRFSGGIAFSCLAGYDFVTNHMRCFLDGQIDEMPSIRPQYLARKYQEYVTAYGEEDQ